MPMPNKLWRFIPLIFIIAVGVFLYRGLSLNPRSIPTVLLNKPAPKIVGVSDKMQGKVWLLNVWASWCQACQVEHPVMMDLAKQRVAVVGLDYRDNIDDAKAWLGRFGNPYKHVVYDTTGNLSIDWGVYGAPETFIIDKQGIIRYKHIGQLNHKVWRSQLKPLIESLR